MRIFRVVLLLPVIGLSALLAPLSGVILLPSLLPTASALAASPPIAITGEEPVQVKRANAIVTGFVIPSEEVATTYYFEYGTAPCNTTAGTCGIKTPIKGPLSEPETVEPTRLQRLKLGTTYHYWLVASNPNGTSDGEEEAFKTALTVPDEYAFVKNFQGYSFHFPRGVGVNQTTGDVYVSDVGASPPSIEQFSSEGLWLSSVNMPSGGGAVEEPRQLAVDNSAGPSQGDIYIAENIAGVVYKFDPNAKGELELDPVTPKIPETGVISGPQGVAVDSSGDVYIANEAGTVSKFSSTGALIQEGLITGLEGVRGLAVDAAGNIYVATTSHGTAEYTAAGACVKPGVNPGECIPIDGDFSQSVALDAAGDVFVADGISETVREFGPTEEHLPIANQELERAGEPEPLGLAVNNTRKTLYVAGTRDSARIFRFRETAPVVVKTEPATQVSGPVEALNGTVNPGGQEPAEYYFEYGPAPCNTLAETCGTVATEPSQVPVEGDEAIPVAVRLDNLAPNTTYHAWVVGANEELGVQHGEEVTFTTGSEVARPAKNETELPSPSPGKGTSEVEYPLLTSIAPVPGPKETAPVIHPLTRAQKLQRALRNCKRDRSKKTRTSCQKRARRTYGTSKKK